MSVLDPTRTTSPRRHSTRVAYPGAAFAFLCLGLLFSALTAVVAFVDQASLGVLEDHVRSGYPEYTPAELDGAVDAYVGYLAIVAGIGAVAWIVTLVAARRGRRWARYFAAVAFLVGASIAVFDLLIKEPNGVAGFPALHGWLGLLPVLAGLFALIALWGGGVSGTRASKSRRTGERN